MPFPLIKLASLLVKQLGKPMSNAIKRGAKSSPTFQNICISAAEGYHAFDINVRMRILGLGKPKEKQKLNPQNAVALGADLISEGFMYMFFAGILVTEYKISSRNTEQEKEIAKQKAVDLQYKVDALEIESSTRDAEIRELRRMVGDLDSKYQSLVESSKKKK